jgi:hypothetical protein
MVFTIGPVFLPNSLPHPYTEEEYEKMKDVLNRMTKDITKSPFYFLNS